MDNNLTKIYNRSLKGPLIFFVVIMLLPFIFQSNNYILSTFIMIGFYSLVTTGLTLLIGYAGQISLGHAAFYGIGAYTSAYFTATLQMPSWVGILVGAIIASLVSLIIGIPVFKLKGHYLALATLGFGVIIFTFFKEWKTITGGLNGFFGIPPLSLFGISFSTDFQFYFLIWIFVFLGIFFARNIVQSRVGRALMSIHGSEIASEAIGININKYKLQIFVLSAVYASIAGSLYAHYVTFINPQLFEMMTSIYFLIMVVIGGIGNIWGGLIGAAIYVFLGELLKDIVPKIIPNASGEFEIVFFGVLLVVILIYMPNGISKAIFHFIKRITSSFKNKPVSAFSKKSTGSDIHD
ncbi:branched-chain amino acid ABC transporter permease [Aeribacillus composti]|uniref:branched-chain amino acid ABC transporter permease n=1 Tax=Aeribacillus composti TaxID=1868734 RepID=UPI002E233542|nr:branched-chain amino acid ABC transporter permease [Aeribacillus composti]MED0746230.1 branched-chain amino acid ABC transporter permease [Aeribacillus composti]